MADCEAKRITGNEVVCTTEEFFIELALWKKIVWFSYDNCMKNFYAYRNYMISIQ